MDELLGAASTLEREAQQHEADATAFDRAEAEREVLALHARKWTAQQAEALSLELGRLAQVRELDGFIKAANPAPVSKKAGEMAETLITEAYVARFNDELKALGASRLRVELVKTRALHGKVLHRVLLKGVPAKGLSVTDVLSEGERRVIELAAFFADVVGRSTKAPFIFDDPISSLDQDYEEKTVRRLVELSRDRQVLVFTHRLSLLGLLRDAASSIVQIRHEPWGAGEPGGLHILANKPINALNDLKNSRVPSAAKTLQADGSEAYYPLGKSICGDIRIVMELIVEHVLLSGVIKRHSREVHTRNIIGKLAAITPRDCSFVDMIMTKYSVYEHSQSQEAPASPLGPEELRADIDEILAWHDEFKARAAASQPAT